ncbi:MAG TPA: PDZ domain-containing protein [Terriglobales bacterium]|nr:PDZ domain-containing protein [Terriglobales bacterium]
MKSARVLPVLLLLAAGFSQNSTPTAAPRPDLPRKGYLGVSLHDPQPGKPGAEIRRVTPGTAAAQLGLKSGDRILSVNSTPLNDPIAIDRAWETLRAGDQVKLGVLRDGKESALVVTVPPLPKEEIQDFDVIYGSVTADKGLRLRTILTRPRSATGRLPGIFLVGWLSCDSAEAPLGIQDGFARFIRNLITQSGFVMMRMDKPGVGDSEGICSDTDFLTELAGYRAAFESFTRSQYVDPKKIVMLGMSNGGGVLPLVAGDYPVAGYVVSGGWVKTWLEHMLEIERRRLTLSGKNPGEVSDQMRGYEEFYDLYLNGVKTPGEVLREKPNLAPLWTEDGGHQYGRPAAFYQQLQDLNLAAAWQKVNVPVLSVHGEYDWIMTGQDHQMIAGIVNANKPGFGKFVEIPKMDHGYNVYETPVAAFNGTGGRFSETVSPLVLEWLRQTVKP